MSAPGLDVDAFLDRLRGIAGEWQQAHAELESLRVHAESADGVAAAVADSGGTVVDLTLAPDLRRYGPVRTSEAILEATALAVGEANSRRASLISHSVGVVVDARARDGADGSPTHRW